MENEEDKERRRLEGYWCPERDEREPKAVGVLLSDEIEYYVNLCRMIDPFEPNNLLSAAGYELTVGDEYSLGGESKKLSEGEEIRIDAFQVAIIKTRETLNLPRFIIARWNIRVRWAYKGLLWVGGPQVDPGWVGRLCCPIYNLSDKPVTIRYGDPIARMDFVTTTSFNKASAKHEYKRPPKRILFEDYKPEELKSALYTEAKRESIRSSSGPKRIETIETQVNTFVGVTITVFTVLFAVLALFVSPTEKAVPWWSFASAALSVFALIVSVYVFFSTKATRQK